MILAHQIDRLSFKHPESIVFIEITGKPYPVGYLGKLELKIKAWFTLWKVLKMYSFNLVWICVWDFRFIKRALSFFSFKGKVVYHFLELDPNNFRFCKDADHIIVPEENRAWLTYFMAKLPQHPWVLPNIPVVDTLSTPFKIPPFLQKLIDEDKVIVFYSGLIDFEKRCLHELITAIALLDHRFHLVLMPGKKLDITFLKTLESRFAKMGATGKVHFIETVAAPHHLKYFKLATVGIGLYRPSSLNQVYAAPNRIYEFSAFGVPVILPHFPHFGSFQNKYPFGIVTADPENIEDIKNKIEMFADKAILQQGRLNSARFFEENGNYAKYAEEILNRIAAL